MRGIRRCPPGPLPAPGGPAPPRPRRPRPRVRHRAAALVLVADGLTLTEAARLLGRSRTSLRAWRDRFLAAGRAGRPGPPRPPAGAGRGGQAARRLLADALAESPLDHGYPVTTWTVADLADLLGRRGWAVSAATVSRTLHALGYRYRRPRHDLTHRQDAAAVASAEHALAELQTRGLPPGPASALSTWTRATCTPIPTWRRSGSAAASR
jgi:transposase